MRKIAVVAAFAAAQIVLSIPCEATTVVKTVANATVTILEADSSDDCVYFQLAGQPEANPVVPNSPWYAFSRTAVGGPNLLALLLSIRVSGANLARVVTAGGVVCGTAQVLTVDF